MARCRAVAAARARHDPGPRERVGFRRCRHGGRPWFTDARQLVLPARTGDVRVLFRGRRVARAGAPPPAPAGGPRGDAAGAAVVADVVDGHVGDLGLL